MVLYFKKIKFRKFIKECGILDDKEIRKKNWFGDLLYIRKGLKEWEKKILEKEINKRITIKVMEENRKEFFDTWKIK